MGKQVYFDESGAIPPEAWKRLGQSRRHSAAESVANVLVGYIIATGSNMIVLPAFGYAVSVADAAGIGLVFTVISLIRSYVLRRVFNWLHLRQMWK